MTSIEIGRALPAQLRNASGLVVLGLSSVAWVLLALWSQSMGNGPGTMGLGVGRFVGMWTVMMTAMMLPAVAGTQVASAEGSAWNHAAGAVVFALSFLGVWTVVGFPAYWAALGTGNAATSQFGSRLVGAGIFLVYALFQISPAKTRLLSRCRRIAHDQGPPADTVETLRRGLRYGLTCVACSWAAMGLMLAFGVMEVAAMAVLAGVIYAERRRAHPLIPKVAGGFGLVYGTAVLAWPALAPGLHAASTAMHMGR